MIVKILLVNLLTAILGHADVKPLSVRTLALEEGDFPEWYVNTGNQQFKLLKWSSRQASPKLTVQSEKELFLYHKEFNGNGEEEFKLAKKVAIPEQADEVILLAWLTDNETEEEEETEEAEGGKEKTVNLLAIADNYKKAKFNEWLLINQSDQEVSLRYGKENDAITVESGDAKIYSIIGEPDKGSEVIAEAMIKGEMRKIYSTFWSASAKQRSIVLFYNKDDRPKLRRIIDFLNPDK